VAPDLFRNPGIPRKVSNGRSLRKLRTNSFLVLGDQFSTAIQAIYTSIPAQSPFRSTVFLYLLRNPGIPNELPRFLRNLSSAP